MELGGFAMPERGRFEPLEQSFPNKGYMYLFIEPNSLTILTIDMICHLNFEKIGILHACEVRIVLKFFLGGVVQNAKTHDEQHIR